MKGTFAGEDKSKRWVAVRSHIQWMLLVTTFGNEEGEVTRIVISKIVCLINTFF